MEDIQSQKLTKKEKLAQSLIEPGKIYDFVDAVKIFKDIASQSKMKFVESLDIAINLGIDSKKGDHMIRGMLSLPVSSGKDIKIAVFAEGAEATQATEAGAAKVGMDDLAESMKKGELDYDVVIAMPDAMKLVGQLGRLLGPKGLMPNPKDGTVTKDIGNAVKLALAGQVRIRNDKEGIVHCSIGKIDTSATDLEKNFIALVNEIRHLKPKTSKGVYLKKLTISSTMGPGVQVNIPTG